MDGDEHNEVGHVLRVEICLEDGEHGQRGHDGEHECRCQCEATR